MILKCSHNNVFIVYITEENTIYHKRCYCNGMVVKTYGANNFHVTFSNLLYVTFHFNKYDSDMY